MRTSHRLESLNCSPNTVVAEFLREFPVKIFGFFLAEICLWFRCGKMRRAKNLKVQKPNACLWLLVDKFHIAMFTRYKSKIKTRHARGGNGQWSREASMLERNAGLKFRARANAVRRLGRVGAPLGGISLLFLELGGCMTLGSTPPPPSTADSPPIADSQPLPNRATQVSSPQPAVDNISTYVGLPPAKMAPREKKREHRAQNAPQVASAAPVSQAKGSSSSIDPGRLIGMAPAAVRELLGPPLRIESYDLSREWVYAANGCSFRLFFYPNLNTAAFRVLKYGGSDGNGELMDVSDVCIRHILTARKNATG
jgi:hypothetical protein